MAKITEKRLYAVQPQLFTTDGTASGSFTVADSSLFVVGHIVTIKSNTQNPQQLKVKRITNSTNIIVGLDSTPIHKYSDISAFLVADMATIEANEQNRPSIPQQEIERSTYAEEPANARRTLIVDKHGNVIDENNPLPVDATISVVVPPIEVNLDAITPPSKSDPDNVLIVGTENGNKDGTKYAFINNIRLQILGSHDREQQISYADFGTKNQRITQIDYTSNTFPGVIASKIILYTLVGNKYRRDSINWVIS